MPLKVQAYVSWAVATVVLCFAMNAIIGTLTPRTSEDAFATIVAEREGFRADELTMIGFGHASDVVGRTCWMELEMPGEQPKRVRVTMARGLHILPWRVTDYSRGGE